MIVCRSKAEIDKLRRVNQLVAEVLAELRRMAAPGVTAEDFPCDIIGPFFYETDLLSERLPVSAGEARPPEGPGLGVELDERAVERYRVK